MQGVVDGTEQLACGELLCMMRCAAGAVQHDSAAAGRLHLEQRATVHGSARLGSCSSSTAPRCPLTNQALAHVAQRVRVGQRTNAMQHRGAAADAEHAGSCGAQRGGKRAINWKWDGAGNQGSLAAEPQYRGGAHRLTACTVAALPGQQSAKPTNQQLAPPEMRAYTYFSLSAAQVAGRAGVHSTVRAAKRYEQLQVADVG